jgi:hypothetical protein
MFLIVLSFMLVTSRTDFSTVSFKVVFIPDTFYSALNVENHKEDSLL